MSGWVIEWLTEWLLGDLDFDDLLLLPYLLFSNNPEVLAKRRKRTEEEKQNDRAWYDKTFNSQKFKNTYVLLLKKMSKVIDRGENLESEYRILIDHLGDEIKNQE